MSLTLQINVSGSAPAKAAKLRGIMLDRAEMNASIGRDVLLLVQKHGAKVSAVEHRSAESLGATPTRHLEKAYQAIQPVSDSTTATLLIPRASRLRAAFGTYTIRPTKPGGMLTIPVAAEAYGHRAKEFDLFPIVVGPLKTPILCRKDGSGNLTTMYLLVPEATIPEDRGLLPFDEIPAQAIRSIEAFMDDKHAAAV